MAFLCPECGKGEMIEQEATHKISLGGAVVDARIFRCTECKEISISGAELKRLRAIVEIEQEGQKCPGRSFRRMTSD